MGRQTRAEPRWKEWGFARWLTVWTGLGLVIRILTVLGRPNRVPVADAFYYSGAANLLVQGKGFINPFLYYWGHQSVPSAQFPPGFVFTLAAASVVGFKSFFAHRIWCAILGAVAVAVCGLAGREIGGRRVGLITAFLVAVYPNIWMSDEMALSETITPLVVALVLLAAYRLWKAPSLKTGVVMGVVLGVAMLTRDELSLLGLVVVIPMVLRAGGVAWRRRILILATAALSAVPIAVPWIGFNMSRFRDPVYVSTGLGPTLASADCAQTWSGPLIGYWSWPCEQAPPPHPGYDESQTSAAAKAYAMRYVHAHESRLPVVALARIGRGFALFHPFQQVHLDASESRPLHWALAGLWMYYALLPLALIGAFALRRRRVPLLPLAGVGFTVVVSMVLAFGNTRYRMPFEVCLVVLAAAGIDRVWSRLRSGDGSVRSGGDGGRVLAEATDRVSLAGAVAGPVDRAPEGSV